MVATQLSFASIAAVWYGEEKDDLTAAQRMARTQAERAYNTRLKAKFEAMDQRFERGERLAAWELRIVRNRMENGREIKGAA